MRLLRAWKVADSHKELFVPYCVRVEVAGSIRRGVAEVGDIEIVVAPRLPYDLFGQQVVNAPAELDAAIKYMIEEGVLPRPVKDGPRYKQFPLSSGINLDLFIVRPPAEWGVIYTIRTGPRDFSTWIVSPRQQGGALPAGYKVAQGAVWRLRDGVKVSTSTEIDFFSLLGLGWCEPAARRARWATGGLAKGQHSLGAGAQ